VPDLVGLGALNLDVIIDGSSSRSVDLSDRRLGLRPDDVGAERALTAAESEVALDYLSSFAPVVSPGGSSLNVMAAVAATGAASSVGFVGVCGRRPIGGLSLADWLNGSGIDTSMVELVDESPGLCLAVNVEGQRTLLTTAGANERLARHLRDGHDHIGRYLSRARLVHITSLTGPPPDSLVELVGWLRAEHPHVRLSVDPGELWARTDSDSIAALFESCHQLLVNDRELVALGGQDPGNLFDRFADLELVVVKGRDRMTVYDRSVRRGGEPISRYDNPRVLQPDQIVDDTGAGDAFAAGFLLAQLADDNRSGLLAGLQLGSDLARAKLGFPGITGVGAFAEHYERWAARQPR
jgi:sugar/nucleoside kinase (ribokinase family)